MTRQTSRRTAMSLFALLFLALASAALLACARAANVFKDPELLDTACTYLEIGMRPYPNRPVKIVEFPGITYSTKKTLVEIENLCGDGHRLYLTRISACTINGNTLSSPTLEPQSKSDPMSNVEMSCRVWPRGCERCPEGVQVDYIQICDVETEGRRKMV